MKHCLLRSLSPLLLFCLIVASLAMPSRAAEPNFPPPESRRILFLGDSITYAGHYVAIIDAQLRASRPQRHWEVLGLGLPSETCSGLSEPDHPYPRPDVHERLERALARFKPDLVVACYGMNDGIYYPFSEERFAAYRRGVDSLIEKVTASGAKLVLLTPPPFDPLPLRKKGKLRGAGAEKFAWFAIYENYDDVLKRYAAWIMQQHERVEMVIDLHTPISKYVAARRLQSPEFTMSPDGVHLDRQGHRLIARAILAAWGRELASATAECDAGKADNAAPSPTALPNSLLQLCEKRSLLLRDAWLSHVGHLRPGVKAGLPLDKATDQAAEIDRQIDAMLAK